jgi:CRP-like cAMP-binding protein
MNQQDMAELSAEQATSLRETLITSYLAVDLPAYAIDQLVSLAHLREFAAGSSITTQDDDEAHLMVLSTGRAVVRAFSDDPVYTLKPGMLFGEVSLIDEKPRSATVSAVEDSTVVVLPAERVRAMIESDPVVGVTVMRNLARVLCARVRAANQQLAVLMTIEELRDHRV